MKMLHKFMIAALILAGHNWTHAQSNPFFDDFEVLGGVNLSWISAEMTDKFEGQNRIGILLGVQKPYQLKERLYLLTGIFFSQQGADYDESDQPITGTPRYTGTYKLSYVNAQTLGEYRITTNFRVQFGPYLGVLVSANDEYEEIGGGFSGEEDASDRFKGLDFGGVVGLSYELTKNLSANLRYQHGISDVYGGDQGFEYRNRVLSLGVAYDIEDLIAPGDISQ